MNMITIVLLEKLAGRSKSAHHDASSPEIITCVLERLIMLKCIEYNSSTKGKCASDTNEILSTNYESEKWDTEVEKDKKVSFDNVTNAG